MGYVECTSSVHKVYTGFVFDDPFLNIMAPNIVMMGVTLAIALVTRSILDLENTGKWIQLLLCLVLLLVLVL